MRHFRDNHELDEVYPYGKLDLRYDGDKVDIRYHLEVDHLLNIPQARRDRIRVYTGHYPFVVTELLGGDFVTMTVLRDPVERTISLLRQFQRKDPWADPNERYPAPMEGLTLEDVYDNQLVFQPLVINHQTKIFSMTADDQLDTYMDVVDIDRDRLQLAKDNLATVDFIGFTDDYFTFLDELTDATGWTIKRDFVKNATPDEWVGPVDESLRERIREDNAIDIEFYEYAKDLVASRR